MKKLKKKFQQRETKDKALGRGGEVKNLRVFSPCEIMLKVVATLRRK